MACRVLYPVFGCPYMHLLSHAADIEFPLRVWPHKTMKEGTMVGRTADGVTDGETVGTEY